MQKSQVIDFGGGKSATVKEFKVSDVRQIIANNQWELLSKLDADTFTSEKYNEIKAFLSPSIDFENTSFDDLYLSELSQVVAGLLAVNTDFLDLLDKTATKLVAWGQTHLTALITPALEQVMAGDLMTRSQPPAPGHNGASSASLIDYNASLTQPSNSTRRASNSSKGGM